MIDIKIIKKTVGECNGWLKSHGLGNDYIVFNSKNINFKMNPEMVRKICDRNYGIGSDGILLLVDSNKADFGLRIYNPDGSEAEKSGNGIRIFIDYLYSLGFTEKKIFNIEIGKAIVSCKVISSNETEIENIEVEIGKATFIPSEIPVKFEGSEAIDIPLDIEDKKYFFSAVSVGNPHAVCIVDNLDHINVKKIGPIVENNPIFPNRTNVQFVQVIDRTNIKIEIWERGAGYTFASGSSSCAVTAVLYKKGYIDNNVNVHMQGGILQVFVDNNFNIKLKGPVTKVACGILLI